LDCYNVQFNYIVASVIVTVPLKIPLEDTNKIVFTLVSSYPFQTLIKADRRYLEEVV